MPTELGMGPVKNPSSSHFRDALQKGLGRAVLWAKKGVWNERNVLLEACLNDFRYDASCEEPRGTWLWGIIGAVGAVDDFREAILEALQTLEDGLAAQQACQFCVLYAQRGDGRFRRRLQEIVAQKPVADCPWRGEEELIDLDREAGFLFAVRARGEAFLNREWDWDDTALVRAAVERLGEQAVVVLLDQESPASADVGRFRTNWLAARERKSPEPGQGLAERMRQLSLDEIVGQAENARNRAAVFRGWGMYAQEADLQAVLARLLQSRNPDVLVNYLRIFSNRPMPRFDERVLGLLDHADANVRGRAYTTVAQNTHPAIRHFAIQNVQERFAAPNFLELFVKNFQPEDGKLLLSHLRVPDDPDQRHSLMMDLIKIVEQNPSAPCLELAVPAYGATPCSVCRSKAVKLLATRKVAPSWLVEECRWDSNSATRAFALSPSPLP